MTRVSGIDRFAVHTTEPFARSLSYGDSGRDVADLNALLSSLGYSTTAGELFTWETRGAVRDLAKKIGATSDGVFDSAWIVYLPRQQVQILASNLVIGAPAPPAGEPLFETAAELASATLVAQTEESSAVSSEDDLPFRMPIVASNDEVLRVGTDEFRLTESRDQVWSEDLPKLRGRLAEAPSRISGALWSESVADSWRIPTGAVFSDDDGVTCVLEGPRDAFNPVLVSVLSESRGTAIVRGDLAEDRPVMVAPAAAERRCP